MQKLNRSKEISQQLVEHSNHIQFLFKIFIIIFSLLPICGLWHISSILSKVNLYTVIVTIIIISLNFLVYLILNKKVNVPSYDVYSTLIASICNGFFTSFWFITIDDIYVNNASLNNFFKHAFLETPIFSHSDPIVRMLFVSILIQYIPFAFIVITNRYLKLSTNLANQTLNVDKKEKDLVDTIEMIQHEIGNKIPIAKENLTTLERALTFNSINMDSKIAATIQGESIDDIESIAMVISNAKNNLDYSLSAIQSLGQLLDVNKYEAEKVFLIQAIRDNLINHKYSFAIEFGEKGKEVTFDVKHLKIMIDNFLRNAEKHAFLNKSSNDKVKFEYDDVENCLLIMNNGKPFPIDFKIIDFLKSGSKRGNNGRGIGGFIISKILEKNNCSIELLNGDKDFITLFKIKLNGN
jgi:hypothetical protein